MKTDFYYPSSGAGAIHGCRWEPEEAPKAVVQLVHGIAEHIRRYDGFAAYLNSLGYVVVAEDHMGHGDSIGKDGIQGYFHGGWFAAVEDSYQLLRKTREDYPELPYILFGHSMGSFMVRTILAKHPDSGISGCVICGTGWQPKALLSVAIPICKLVAKRTGETKPSPALQGLVFGGYNRRVEHPRTAFDWLNRNEKCVDAYLADPLCGFTASAGLLRDMLTGISYIEEKSSLAAMEKELPVFFIAGGDDPVGNYGEGVRRAAQEFRKAGMKNVSVKIYPLCRHEILNELNKQEVYQDVAKWMDGVLKPAN